MKNELHPIKKLIATAIAVVIGSFILPGVEVEDSLLTIFILAGVLAILNTFLKPLLIFFTLPATIVTLGLFLLVINAVIILIADWMVKGFEVRNFWWALLFSFLISVVSSFFEPKRRKIRPEDFQ
jgi:putative membrane protein